MSRLPVLTEFPVGIRLEATEEWDHSPHNFSGDANCPGAALCGLRSESFGEPVQPGTASEWRRVEFDLDDRVEVFRIRLIVALDLVELP